MSYNKGIKKMTSKQFKEARRDLGFTQAAAARICHVPLRTWCSWEDAERRLPGFAPILIDYLESRR